MKKVILCLAASLFVALGIYAQESKPVIGLTEIGFVKGQTVLKTIRMLRFKSERHFLLQL